MSNGGPPPECDLACQTKIIIDGGLAGRVFEETCKGLYYFFEHGGKLKDAQKLLEALIRAENAAFEFMRIAHSEIGYKGPLPDALKVKAG